MKFDKFDEKKNDKKTIGLVNEYILYFIFFIFKILFLKNIYEEEEIKKKAFGNKIY